ncbi:MAG: 50S ribosomal protein L18 [Candidatus Thorarchaeota archaeon]|nr:50S ribosomal protein L18 [Candidatus Thorarchaeota archaeon]
MAQGPTYRLKFRRRREGKTNYYRRRRLLLSRRPRLVIRKTNNRTIVQVITANVAGDITVASAESTELVRFGWDAGKSNLPAAYLTGFLAALRAKARGVDAAVLDIGLIPPVKGSKVYGALKGAIDAGLDVPHDEEVIPDEERISGKHIVDAYQYYSDNPGDGYNFSILGKKKTTITTIPKQFSAAKKAMLEIPKVDLKKKSKKPAAKPAAKKTPKKEKKPKLEETPPRAVPRKPKPKKLISRGRGKKGKKGKI